MSHPWLRPVSAAWDTRQWLVLPTDSAVHRDDLGPCGGCGSWTLDLVVIRSETAPEDGSPPVVTWRSNALCVACCTAARTLPKNMTVVGTVNVAPASLSWHLNDGSASRYLGEPQCCS